MRERVSRARTPVCVLLSAAAFLGTALSNASSADASFGISNFKVEATQQGNTPATLAGSHPLALTTNLDFTPGPELPGEPGVPVSEEDLRELEIELPPGLIENPAAVPRCSQALFHTPRGQTPFEASLSGESCPQRSQIGVVEVRSSYGGGSARSFGVFNLDPPPGAPSAFGFNPYGAPIVFAPRVRQAQGEYGLTLATHNVSQLVDLYGFSLEIWGTPWSVLHNSRRGECLNEAEPDFGWAKCSVGQPATNPPLAYLTLPTACGEALSFGARAGSWQQPDRIVSRSFEAPGLQGCADLRFDPFASGALSDPRASSPSGFDFALAVDNEGFLLPGFRAPSPLRTALLTLPDQMTINPSVGAGLGVCTPASYAAETVSSPPGAGCPNASKIGDFTVRSPLFGKPIEGALFLAAPHQNPFGTLLAVYLVAKAPERGVLVALAGRLDADPASGSLTATFDRLPQLPYTDLRVHFREGQRSPLATPATCGAFSTAIELSPWSGLQSAVHRDSPITIAAGLDGGPCPLGTPGFAPRALAGTLNSNAGSYSPFYLHLTRRDTEQEITSYSATLPPGLTGRLAAIPYCPEEAIEAAKRNSGFAEIAAPSCPPASRIGHTIAGYGLGPVLTYAPGGLYLAGPFGGSPFSIVAIDSATVGPFDLGVIVVRSAIDVDRRSARVSIDSEGSDPIPHIIDGIPIHLRDVRVYISRPGFTLNPTSCERFAVASTLSGSGPRFSDPSDDSTATATAPFQAFDCRALGFSPRISLRLRGGTRRGSYPALRAVVRPRARNANIASARVTLPPSLFLAQNHIGTICTGVQYVREDCPPGSVYGHARVFTPLLDQPLEGNVYLRSSQGTLPDLAVALRGGGRGIAIDLIGTIDSQGGGLRASFEGLPDAPFSKFVLTLPAGRRGPLVNSTNVCRARRQIRVRFLGHNDMGERGRLQMPVSCPAGARVGAGSRGGGTRR